MELEQQALDAFLRVHIAKARDAPDDEAGVLLVDYRESGIPLEATAFFHTREDVIDRFDTNSPLVLHLIKQIEDQDPNTNVVMGLVFDNQRVLAQVIKRPRGV